MVKKASRKAGSKKARPKAKPVRIKAAKPKRSAAGARKSAKRTRASKYDQPGAPWWKKLI